MGARPSRSRLLNALPSDSPGPLAARRAARGVLRGAAWEVGHKRTYNAFVNRGPLHELDPGKVK
eukprot:11725355-Alexandrium_andersonii.AAC.1